MHAQVVNAKRSSGTITTRKVTADVYETQAGVCVVLLSPSLKSITWARLRSLYRACCP